jgi:hypothetical protein
MATSRARAGPALREKSCFNARMGERLPAAVQVELDCIEQSPRCRR